MTARNIGSGLASPRMFLGRLIIIRIQSNARLFQQPARQAWGPVQQALNQVEYEGQRGNWEAAREALLVAMGHSPINWEPEGNMVSDLYPKAMLVLALTEDWQHYADLCGDAIEHADISQSYYNVALFMTNGLPPALAEKSIQMADWEAECRHGPWVSLRAGLAAYRAGNATRAVALLSSAQEAFNLNCSGCAYATAAMAANQVDQPVRAHAFLDRAEQVHHTILTGNPDHLGRDWHQTALLDVLLKEARELVR